MFTSAWFYTGCVSDLTDMANFIICNKGIMLQCIQYYEKGDSLNFNVLLLNIPNWNKSIDTNTNLFMVLKYEDLSLAYQGTSHQLLVPCYCGALWLVTSARKIGKASMES